MDRSDEKRRAGRPRRGNRPPAPWDEIEKAYVTGEVDSPFRGLRRGVPMTAAHGGPILELDTSVLPNPSRMIANPIAKRLRDSAARAGRTT